MRYRFSEAREQQRMLLLSLLLLLMAEHPKGSPIVTLLSAVVACASHQHYDCWLLISWPASLLSLKAKILLVSLVV